MLAKTHGNMYTLWFGWVPVIILNGFQAVKDGMTTHPEDVSGRLVSPFFRALAKGKGIILASGRSWKHQRRFGIMTLRNLGMGKKGLEHRVQEEASHLVEFFGNLKGRPVDPSFPLFHSISNVICAVVFGYHFSDEDKTFHELIHATEKIFKFAGSFVHQMYEILPWLLCRLPGPHKKVLACYDVLSSFARKEIRRHVERGIPAEPQDFIDFYLAEIEKSKEGAKSKYDEENLVYVINDLFLGGSETSSTTLYWGLLYMVVNPDIQEKVQKELDAVLGPSQLICYEDRRKLPYTNAVVHEIQRFSNIVFVGVPRLCVRNTTLLGFPVKKECGAWGRVTVCGSRNERSLLLGIKVLTQLIRPGKPQIPAHHNCRNQPCLAGDGLRGETGLPKHSLRHPCPAWHSPKCHQATVLSIRLKLALGTETTVSSLQGTIVIPNIASVLYDPEQWETPRQFNPGHFLDKEGNFVPREAFLPFSAGHRVCLGEHLARTELFIFFASLLRAFTFRLPEGVTRLSTEPVMGGTLQPQPYRLCAIPR